MFWLLSYVPVAFSLTAQSVLARDTAAAARAHSQQCAHGRGEGVSFILGHPRTDTRDTAAAARATHSEERVRSRKSLREEGVIDFFLREL